MPIFAKRLTTLTAIALLSGTTVLAQSVPSGSYLAARSAIFDGDYGAAANYLSQALTADAGNAELLDNAVVSFLALGDLARADVVARQLEALGQPSQIAHMVRVATLAGEGNFDEILERVSGRAGIGPLVDGLLRSWSLVGTGDMEAALDSFDAVGEDPGLQGFALYHKALALALVGDFEGAEAILSGPEAGALRQTRRGAMAHVEVLSQLGRLDDAKATLGQAFGSDLDPALKLMDDALTRGEALNFSHINSAQDGMSEVFFTVASALRNEVSEDYTLLYTRVAELLNPGHIDALLLSANLLEQMDRYDLATKTYARVARDDPAYHAAELGRAEALRRADKPDAAIEVLRALTKSHAELPIVHTSLGDALRGQERYADAVAAYSAALDLYDIEERGTWFVHYARGISQERLSNWPEAEADFRQALALSPGQPQVLNYLGYSLVQKESKLDEALEMIEAAAAARPDSGYIIDSLGWVLFRLGRYEEAVGHMERATELMPVDPIVNDHLGDVYWSVGREREAEFQWRRSLSFIDYGNAAEEADPDRVRRKLEIGLDAVLEEEGAPPLRVAEDEE